MGDRAIVVFTNPDRSEVSPSVYLHWLGSAVPSLVDELRALMAPRGCDVSYACARFIGLAHARDVSCSSLGVSNMDWEEHDALVLRQDMSPWSPGDAGYIVVNCDGYTWEAFDGYLTEGMPA
jgi:hypothetical protein